MVNLRHNRQRPLERAIHPTRASEGRETPETHQKETSTGRKRGQRNPKDLRIEEPKIKRPYEKRSTHGPLNSPQEGLLKPEPYLNFLDRAEELTEAPPLGEEIMKGPGELPGKERRTSALSPTAHLVSSVGKG